MKKLLTKSEIKQKEAFFIYFNLGKSRSLKKLDQLCIKKGIKVSMGSLRVWSVGNDWVRKTRAMDNSVLDIVKRTAVDDKVLSKERILEMTKIVMEKAVEQIEKGKVIPTPSDFKKMWEVSRIEMDKPIGKEALMLRPALNIFLTKNTNILKVVAKTSEEIKEALHKEIEEE